MVRELGVVLVVLVSLRVLRVELSRKLKNGFITGFVGSFVAIKGLRREAPYKA